MFALKNTVTEAIEGAFVTRREAELEAERKNAGAGWPLWRVTRGSDHWRKKWASRAEERRHANRAWDT